MNRRNTIQKRIILGTLNELKNHPSGDMVYEKVHESYPSISRATVFRNLKQMVESGEIAKRYIPGSPDRFDHICGDHYHVKCIYCDRVMDVDMDYIPDLSDSVRGAGGFTLLDHNIVFSGVCPDCSQQKKGDSDEKHNNI